MHPNHEELLAIRDGEGAADAARHVDGCAQCSAEIEEFRRAASALRDLPPVATTSDLWPVVRTRIVSRRRRTFALGIVAAVASVVLVVTAVEHLRSPAPMTPAASIGTDTQIAIEELAAASRGLESVLRDPALHNRVLSARQAGVIVDLEDRIAFLDIGLAQDSLGEEGENAVALWSHRVELLDALVVARAGNRGDDEIGYAVMRNEGSQ